MGTEKNVNRAKALPIRLWVPPLNGGYPPCRASAYVASDARAAPVDNPPWPEIRLKTQRVQFCERPVIGSTANSPFRPQPDGRGPASKQTLAGISAGGARQGHEKAG